ncbi:MAG: DUF402 domain-containing protein [Chloroflexi bacterium]|nr:DUF402 domain-containing protein [Chloroflexota bacterium]
MPSKKPTTSNAADLPHPILERKEKPDGSWREYPCTLVRREPGLAVVRFVMERGGAVFGTPIAIPPGSISFGYFWARRPYNLYRMKTVAGEVIAHRFDAVTDVRLGEEAIEYRDLILDWWAQPDGTLVEEDREEFEAALESGGLGAKDLARAHAAARQVFSRYRHIIDEAAAIERKLPAA